MRATVTGTASALGLTLALGLTFAPLGCDSTQALPFPASSPSPHGPEVPPSTERAITRCAERAIAGLSKDYHAVIFDVKANKSGTVLEARVRESHSSRDEIEGCVKQALLAMHVSPWIVSLGSPAPGEGVSRESRGQAGFVQALGAAVELVPILIAVAGVTVIVVVAVYIVSEISTTTRDTTDDEQEKERCKKVLERCIEKCTNETIPSGSLSGDPFFKCRRQCLEAENCW